MDFSKNTLAVMGVTILFSACSSVSRPTTKLTYDNTIRPLMEQRCLMCHGKLSPSLEEFKKDEAGYKARSIGPRMDNYENLMVFVNGSDTGAIMRRLDDGINTKDHKPGNMYQHLGNDDAERAANLALFKRWIGGWSLKRMKDITEEEQKAVLAPRS